MFIRQAQATSRSERINSVCWRCILPIPITYGSRYIYLCNVHRVSDDTDKKCIRHKCAVCALYAAAATATTADNYNNDDNGYNYNASTPLQKHFFTHSHTVCVYAYTSRLRVHLICTEYMLSSRFGAELVFVCMYCMHEYRKKRVDRQRERAGGGVNQGNTKIVDYIQAPAIQEQALLT